MPLSIVKNDIVQMRTDAIVNAANEQLWPGGGVCGAIFRAAGTDELDAACRAIGHCDTGSAVITPGFKLPAKYVVHAVGPVWKGGGHHEEELLTSAYQSSLQLALDNACESISFPLISAGIYGYPRQEALQVAIRAIRGFLQSSDQAADLNVYLVLWNREDVNVDRRLAEMIRLAAESPALSAWHPMGEHPYAGSPPVPEKRKGILSHLNRPDRGAGLKESAKEESAYYADAMPKQASKKPAPKKEPSDAAASVKPSGLWTNPPEAAANSLDRALQNMDESFSESLLRLIDEKGLTDSQAYKRANIDRKHFSKIRSDRLYRPKKNTVLAFAVALRLTLPETNALLEKAGYILSHSSKADIIVEYYINRSRYNLDEINQVLFAYDQPLLGS